MRDVWQKVGGVMTPGGDPCWCCPNCFGGEHVYGVENVCNPEHKCRDCGTLLRYPWEPDDEKNINDVIAYLDHYSNYQVYQTAWETVKKYFGIE